MLRACKVAFIGVLLAIIPEETSVLWADDAKQKQAKPAQQNFTCSGKVVVVDREAGTVTVEVQKRLYLLKLSTESRILRKGKRVSISDLVTGQEITVELVEGPDGAVLVARLFIGPATAETEAAGKGAQAATPADPGVNPATPATPYNGSPNRPPVSPYN